MPQAIVILSTTNGFARSFQDRKLTAQLEEITNSKGNKVRNDLFPVDKSTLPAIKGDIRRLLLPISIKNKASHWHRDFATLPTSVKGEGILPDGFQSHYDQQMVTFHQQMEDAKPASMAALPNCLVYARQVKGDEFNVEKYPTEDGIRSIEFSWNYCLITSVDSVEFEKFLSLMDENRANEIRDRARHEERERNRAAMLELCQRNVRNMDALVRQLNNPDSKFYESVFENVREQADITVLQNIGNDADVTRAVAEVRQLLAGVDLAVLKKSATLKATLGQQLAGASLRFSSIGVRNFGGTPAPAPTPTPIEKAT